MEKAIEHITIDYKNKGGILQCSPHILKLIREHFSVKNPVYMQQRFAARKYVITPSGAFQTGLWFDISNYISSLTIPVKLTLTPEFQKHIKPSLNISKIENIDGFEYYDYQRKTIEEFIKNGRGIGLLATAAGKSLIFAGFCKTLIANNPDIKIVMIVPNVGLLNQLYKSFITEYNVPQITRWGDGYVPDITKNIIIANSQILLSDIKTSLTLLEDFDIVLVDEVHTLGERKNKINKIIQNIHTPNKFGLTGTLPSNLLSAWNIIGKTGPVLIHETAKSIISKGTAADVCIKIIKCAHTKKPDDPDPSDPSPLARYLKEVEFIQSSEGRNNLIVKLANKISSNVLILVDSIAYGTKLFELMNKLEGKEVYFIQGSVETEERARIQALMEAQSNIICIAMTKIFSTGISIKNLKYVIFTRIGKSNIQIAQSIGRSMRKHADKEISTIFDICDVLYYSAEHLLERIKLYGEEKIKFEVKNIKLT